jgi:hypothetical protein
LKGNEEMLTYFKDANEVTAQFFLSQKQTQKYKPRGRKFTLGDKILVLSNYKQSGRSNRFLSQIFSLPSRKVPTDLIKRIPFNCGSQYLLIMCF